MKKLLSLLICFAIMLSCVVSGIGAATAYAAKYEASPESDFIAFDGVIEEYIGPGGDVVIPAEIDGVTTTEIASNAFLNNSEVTSVIFPEGLEKIGHKAFYNCIGIVQIELPYSIYEVGGDVFNGTGITEITIPGSLTKIPYDMFCGCKALETIKISNGVKEIHQGAFGLTSPKRVIFPESLDFIAANAFMYIFTSGSAEFIFCNSDVDIGRKVKDGLWEDMMKGNWSDTITSVFFSSSDYNKTIRMIVPEGSATGAFLKDAENNGLLSPDRTGNNSFTVQEKSADYFEDIKKEIAEYSIDDTRDDLDYGSAGSSSDGSDDDGEDGSEDGSKDDSNDGKTNTSNKNNKNNKNDGNSTTTIVEEGNDSMMWIILAVVGGVFLLLIIGVVVFAVIFLNKPKKAPAAPQVVYMMGPDGKIVPVTQEQPVSDEPEAPVEEAPAEETPAEDAE